MNADQQPQGFRDMPKPQKTAVVILALLGVAVVIFWVLEFRSHLKQPFSVPKENVTSSAVINTHNIDTDGDGLSDYDEINIYHTSPYLEDSDSDGISDLKEIKQGTDPTCAEGRNCNATTIVATSSITTTNPTDLTAVPTLSASGTDSTALQSMMSGQLDATALRQLLISSGADKATLDKISDTDLLNAYQDTLKNQNQNTNSQ